MSSQRVRVGIIGTGFGASVQLPAFLAIKEAEVIGIVSHDPKRSEALQKKYKLPQSFSSCEALIESDDIDLVSIVTESVDHEKLLHAAIKSGKHVLCENPFTLSSDAAKTLLKEANVAGIIHATDFELRESPALKFFISRLMTGVVGRIQTGEFRWSVGTGTDPKLTVFGVHLYNAAEMMLGLLDKVQAVTSEDHATIDLKGKYGIPVRMLLSGIDPKGSGFGITITGEKGILLLESTSPDYGTGRRVREGADVASAKIVYEDPAPNPKVDARIPPFQSLAKRLVLAIKEGDRTFAPSFQDGVRSQMFLEGIRASAEAKSWVDIGKSSLS